MQTLIKITIAILCLLCLADMPYGFFQFVRFVAAGGFVYLALETNKMGRQREFIIYLGLAILFQPLLKISLGRALWNVVDVVVAIGLIISLFRPKNN